MVPDLLSSTRRQLLAGVAGATVVGTAGVGATRPTALPDLLTDAATRHYPDPPGTRDLWRPTVTETHAREAVGFLADTVEAGERLREQLDTDAVDHRFLGAGGWLQTARDTLAEGEYADALWDARSGIQYAAEDLGVARAHLDHPEADPDRLRERLEATRERSRTVQSAVQPYPVAEPGRDLAWYYRIEHELVRSRLTLDWEERLEDTSEPPVDVVARLEQNLRRAELQVDAAERFHALLRDRLDGSETAPQADRLTTVVEEMRAEVESFPSRNVVERRYVGEDDDSSVTPYEYTHRRLAWWLFDYDYRVVDDVARDSLVRRAVDLSEALADRRAHETAVDRLVVEPDDTDFDSGHTFRERGRARSTYQNVVGSNPPPLVTRMAERAISDVRVAEVDGAEPGDGYPWWRARLDAYLYALIGAAKLAEFPPLYRRVAGEPLSAWDG